MTYCLHFNDGGEIIMLDVRTDAHAIDQAAERLLGRGDIKREIAIDDWIPASDCGRITEEFDDAEVIELWDAEDETKCVGVLSRAAN